MAVPHWLACVAWTSLFAVPPVDAPPRPAPKVTRVVASTAQALTPLWRRPVVRTGRHRTITDSLSTPALSRHSARVVVGTAEGVLYALSLHDGSALWRRSYRAPFVGEVALALVPSSLGPQRELALLGASDGVLLAVDTADGSLVWQVPLEFEVTAAPAVQGDVVVVTSETNQVVALELATGQLRWSEGRAARPGLTMQGHARPVIDGERVYCAFSDGFLAAFELATGQPIWTRPLSLQAGSFIDSDATPIVDENRIFAASVTDGVYALTRDEGETLWHRALPDIVSLVYTGHVVFAADTRGHVYLLEPDTGMVRNRVDLGAEPAGALVDLGDTIALTAGPLGLVLLSPTTGRPLGIQSLGGLPGGELHAAHGHLATLTRSGHLMLWQHGADAAAKPRRSRR